jgi:glycosyltransferase involved in cell wall biosynthesis
MKVLMTADTVGGVWTYVLDLARALGARGIDVALATMGARLTPDQARTAGAISTLTVLESTYKLEWMEEPWEDVAEAGEWLLELEGEFRPDIVHLNGYAHGALRWSAPALAVAHSCVLSWWQAVKGCPAPEEWRRYAGEVRRGLQAVDAVIAPTHAMLDAAQRHYGPFRASRVVYNGREPRFFRAAEKESFVFTAGRLWDEAKNIAALNRVASRLPWPVWVAGEEHHPCGGEAENSGVRCTGRLSSAAIADWMGRAPVYALPARYEPFGLSALEAALSGCALVLGDIPSLREVWGDAAVFVPPHDDAALAAALKALIGNRSRREEMARRALARARRYAPEQMAEGYLEAYGELLAGRHRVAAKVMGAREA